MGQRERRWDLEMGLHEEESGRDGTGPLSPSQRRTGAPRMKARRPGESALEAC